MHVLQQLGPDLVTALAMAGGMAWQVGWSLVLGFLISAVLQVVVPKAALRRALGRDGLPQVALATAAGAASSSCSYASAAVSRTLFKGGAALVPSLAFLFASTNLVAELGIVLYLLMGWQFMLGEWLGGIVLIAVMAVLVRLTCPAALVEEARRHPEPGGGHGHAEAEDAKGAGAWAMLRRADTWARIARTMVMDARMLWRDIVLGFLIAGALAAFVPDAAWRAVFVGGAHPWLRVPANALIGPLVAMLSFVCSIGNVPLAAVLWGSGVSFGGVLAFLFADLIVPPLLDVYRRYYGWRMAAYIGAVFYATMVITAVAMDGAFAALGWIPHARPNLRAGMEHFAFDHTFWLNLLAVLAAAALAVIARRAPASTPVRHCCH